MKLTKEEKVFALNELAYFMENGSDVTFLDVISVFDETPLKIHNFVKENRDLFSSDSIIPLLKILQKTREIIFNDTKANRDNLTETFILIDPETGECLIKTTKEDAEIVYDMLQDAGIKKITTGMIYTGLKRYSLKPSRSRVLPFRSYIEKKLTAEKKKSRSK